MFKNINKMHFYNLFLIFIIYFLICKMTIDIEGFEENQEIILMGDSVFDNSNYVDKGESVFEQLQKKHEKTILLAKDKATVEDLLLQFSEIHMHTNNPSTCIFISIGGNDILNYHSSSAIMNENKFIDNLFNDYTDTIRTLYDKWGLKSRIFLCTIYFPKKESYKKYNNMIKMWNNKLKDYAAEYEHNILQLDKILNKEEYFTYDIEPSKLGSTIIVERILKYN